MKPHQQGIHNPLLATDDKGQQRLDRLDMWGLGHVLGSPLLEGLYFSPLLLSEGLVPSLDIH